MIQAIAEYVSLWAVINGGAVLLLAVLSYASSVWALDGLSALDRWWYKRRYVRHDGLGSGNHPALQHDERRGGLIAEE